MRILITFLLFSVATMLQGQVQQICSGETLTFELPQDAWGTPFLQFSEDGDTWEDTSEILGDPIVATPETGGFYRVRLYDEDCDASYFSNTIEVEVLELPEVTLNSMFSDFVIPATTDPYFWVFGFDSVSDVVFYVNGIEYQAETNGMIIPNPGVSFEIYAEATDDATGCTLTTETAFYTVFDPNTSSNAFFEVSGDFDLNQIFAVSSIDEVDLDGDPEFQIEYSEEFGVDFVYAFSHGFGQDTLLVAMTPVPAGTETIVLNDANTALAAAMNHPSFAIYIWTNYEGVEEALTTNQYFPGLVDLFVGQTTTLGYIDLLDEDIENQIQLIADDLSDDIAGGLFSMNTEGYPTFTTTDLVEVNYNHNGLRAYYAAQIYDDTSPISQVIVFPGNQSLFSSALAQSLLNTLVSYPDLTSSLQWPIRQNGKFSTLDLFGSNEFRQFATRLVNGIGEYDTPDDWEVQIAKDLNQVYLMVHFVAALPGVIANGLSGAASVIIEIYNTMVGGINQIFASEVSLENILGVLVPLATVVFSLVELGVTSVIVTTALAVLGVASFILAANDLGQTVYDMEAAENDVFFHHTRVGNRIANKLSVNSNSDQAFYAIPGSYTHIDPFFALEETTVIRKDYGGSFMSGEVLFEEGPISYEDLNGITAYGLFIDGTHSLNFNETEFAPGLGFADQSILSGLNLIEWQVTGDNSTASLPVGLKVNTTEISNIEGLDEDGFLTFNCEVQQAELFAASGDEQLGIAGEVLPDPVVAGFRAVPSNVSIEKYPIVWEVIDGEGMIQSSDSQDPFVNSPLQLETSEGIVLGGLSGVNWLMGNEGEQLLEARALNPITQQVVVDIQFTATLSPCDSPEPGTVCNPATGRIWMDRNLGAAQVATSPTDQAAYGDLYQWGRGFDGHQVRTSPTTSVISSTPVPGNGSFITTSNQGNWLSPQNDELWQGLTGINNPCPEGFRLPTEAEWVEEFGSWGSMTALGAFGSQLKLTTGGGRFPVDGEIINPGSSGYYWSSTVSGELAKRLRVSESVVSIQTFGRAFGKSVRCVKD